MSARAPDICLLIHIYYPGSWKRIKEKCAPLLATARQVIVTCPHPDVIREIDWPGACVLRVPNEGKDIGGKLAAFAYYQRFVPACDYVALIHDKISPQTLHSDSWFDSLFGIFGGELFQKALLTFDARPEVGVIGAGHFVMTNEYDKAAGRFNTTNDEMLRALIRQYDLSSPSYDYISGTIFLARSEPYRAFFGAHPALALRVGLEPGNVMDFEKGTYTHCWERLFCYIASAKGLKVIGI